MEGTHGSHDGSPRRPVSIKLRFGTGVWPAHVATVGPHDDGWEDRETYVHIHGVKRAQRDRIVPRVVTPVRPACWPGLMRRVLAPASEKALGVVVQPYDHRRSFSQWLEHAGIERTHVPLYMGHGDRTMTDVYLWREMLKFVEGDSATLAAWIERDRTTAKAKAAAADAATGLRVVK